MAYINAYVVTFNCGRALIEPEIFGEHFLSGWKDPQSGNRPLPDLIVLNLQEIAPIGYAFLGGNFVKPYMDYFVKAIKLSTDKASSVAEDGSDAYVNILSRHSGLTALMIFAREDVADDIRSINVADVGVGFSEMANKGAIGARIRWRRSDSDGDVFTTFVSAHLAPFESEIARRDQDYLDITKRLVFSTEDVLQMRKGQNKPEDVPLLDQDSLQHAEISKKEGMYADDTFLFFSGDLNYRTALSTPSKEDPQHFPQRVDDKKDHGHYSQLLDKDQLAQQLHNGKTLHGLTEQLIDFPPTYKYKINDRKPAILDEDAEAWDWAQHRWPSWCDRILFSSSDALKLLPGKYSALPIFRTSDHRPVAFSVAIPFRALSNSGFSKEAPASLDLNAWSRREAAKRKELIVGLGAYLSLTWEGRSLVLGTIVFVLGAVALYKAMA